MTRIGLLSDTHGFIDPTLATHFDECDEIWHAGDLGPLACLDQLAIYGKPIRLVYGNIDAHDVRAECALDLVFDCEKVGVLITHIAGYRAKYSARVQKIISSESPDLVICGHSHILKVIYDHTWQHLHINPGAAGYHGFHKLRTAMRFTIDGDQVKDMQVIELGPRARK